MPAKENAYSKAFKKYHGSIKSLMWNSYSSAARRYKELVKDINFSNKSVLDIGCGFGDIIPFISNESDLFKYTGIDFTKDLIEEAEKRYPDFRFVNGDYFKNPPKEKFDIIICSGALNGNYGKKTLNFRKKAIEKMFNHCKDAFVFNMAGSISPVNKKDSIIYYADSIKILEYCATLSKKIILRNHYHGKDFTIAIFK